MELDTLKSQTTWNDAATSINSNFAKIVQAIASLEVGGGSGVDVEQLEAFLRENGYTTEDWVLQQEFLKEIVNGDFVSVQEKNKVGLIIDENGGLGDTGSGLGVVSFPVEVIAEAISTMKTLGDWFYKSEDGKSIGTTYNFFSEHEISADGLNYGGGIQVLGASSLGQVTSENDSTTFSAYAIDTIYKKVVQLEQNGGGTGGGEGSLVSWIGTISSGKKIGTLTINGTSNNLYAPSTYGWSDITNKPTKLSEFTDDVVAGNYLSLDGGTMKGSIITPADDNKGIIPATHNYGQIGSSTKSFFRMYATTFYGNLSGNASSASAVPWSGVTNAPTKLSDFTNDEGYITELALTSYATKKWVEDQKFATTTQLDSYLPLAGGTISNNLAIGGTLKVTGTSTFTGKTTHNGGVATTTLSASSTSTFTGKTTHNGGIATSTLSASSTSTFTGKTTHNGGIETTTLTTSGNVTVGGSLTIGGFKIDVSSGNLRLNGTAFATGEFSANGLSTDTTIINRIAALERRVSELE